MDWSKVQKEHVEAAIQKFIEEKPQHPKPRSYYLMYNGEKLPSKYIRGLAYSIATGEELSLKGFNGGVETVDFFAKHGYTVEQISNDEDNKYSVNQAVWIATAMLAFEKYNFDPDVTREDMYFKQSDIVHRAQLLVKVKVDSARVSWWVNADNEKATQNYLRADQLGNSTTRRLSMIDEFPDKTYPVELDGQDELEIDGQLLTIDELLDFVRNVYPEVMKKMQPIDIDYIGVLDYLANNQEIPYSNPDAEGLAEDEKNNLLAIKQRGKNAVAEMKKMAARCEDLYGLDKCLPGSWLDGSNTKTRKYLWTQMKYKAQAENPISISLFVEQNDGVARYRICLEIKNDGADKNIMQKYHSHLDIPAQPGMFYVSGSNEWGNPTVISGSQEDIKGQVEDGTLRKVQLCIYVETTEGKTNEEFDAEIMEAVKKMLPYYEHVIDNTEQGSGRAWLLIWNPDNWDWEDYKEQCMATKQGETCIIPWTCSNKRPVEGDEVFLIKTGNQPRGIIAHGRVARAAYQAPHYDPEKAAQGVMTGHIDAEYDWIQDYETENMLLQDVLKKQFADQQWSPMGSGIEIKAEILLELRKMWKELIGADDGYWPSYEEYPDYLTKEDGMNDAEFDKNMILYGPPGTGKTYNTVIYAVAICTGKSKEAVSSEPYSEVLDEYNKLKKQGRIAFTTFHQSYGYEEFIEGIKPVLDGGSEIGYTIEDGVFKAFCNSAVRVKNQAIAKYASVWGVRYNTSKNWKEEAEIKKECFEKGIIEFDWNKLESDVNARFIDDIKIGDYVAIHLKENHIDAIGKIVGNARFDKDKEKYKWSRQVEWLITGADIDIQYANNGKAFHNFELARLSSIKPIELLKLIPGNENIDQESKLPYVFIIDEINRGNISKIFGELITLIEDTKRAGAEEAASATLPYSGDSFSVPSNVYILGTMNTADRSIALMDTALRRRFRFEEKMPNSDILRKLGADMVEDLDVAKMLDTINERITYLYDREHKIGHAFFTGLADDPSVEKLASIFEKSVIPLLQEYFYEDYQKIQLVLGDNGKTDDSYKFIKDVPVVVKNVFKGNVEDVIDIPEKKYELNKAALKNIQSYKEIM